MVTSVADLTIPDHVPEVPCLDKSVELGVAAADSELGWKSTMPVIAKLLHGVRDPKGTFVLLKSITGHLCSIVGNCQVRPPLST